MWLKDDICGFAATIRENHPVTLRVPPLLRKEGSLIESTQNSPPYEGGVPEGRGGSPSKLEDLTLIPFIYGNFAIKLPRSVVP